MMRNVAHVLRRFVPSEWGGIEAAAYNLSRELQHRGIGSSIYTTDMLAHCGADVYQGVAIHRYPYVFPWLGLSDESREKMERKGGSPLSLGLFRSLLHAPNLHLIHAHTENRLGGTARTVARMRKIPYVLTIHAGHATLPSFQSEEMMKPFRSNWEWGKVFGLLLGSRRTIEDADAIICVSREEHLKLRERYPYKTIEYIPNGVHENFLQAHDGELFRHTYGFAQDDRILLNVARFDDQKNQLLLLDSFSDCLRRYPETKLVLIGPVSVPDYYQKVQDRIRALGIQHAVTLIPGLDQDDPLLLSAYHAAELFVLSSRVEQQGIVIMEAWAAGTPVVASRTGGIPLFTQDGRDAVHFENENREDLTRALLLVMESEPLQQKLITNGKEEVSAKYTWKVVTDRLLQVYETARLPYLRWEVTS